MRRNTYFSCRCFAETEASVDEPLVDDQSHGFGLVLESFLEISFMLSIIDGLIPDLWYLHCPLHSLSRRDLSLCHDVDLGNLVSVLHLLNLHCLLDGPNDGLFSKLQYIHDLPGNPLSLWSLQEVVLRASLWERR